VLPFSVMGGGDDLEDFADGLTRTSPRASRGSRPARDRAQHDVHYKRRPVDIRSLGRELGATYVLEGA